MPETYFAYLSDGEMVCAEDMRLVGACQIALYLVRQKDWKEVFMSLRDILILLGMEPESREIHGTEHSCRVVV